LTTAEQRTCTPQLKGPRDKKTLIAEMIMRRFLDMCKGERGYQDRAEKLNVLVKHNC